MFRSLEEIGERSQALLEKKDGARFLDKSKDSQEVANLVEQLRTAIVYYQVSRATRCRSELTRMEQLSQQQSIYNQMGKLTVRFLIGHILDPSVDEALDSISLSLTHS